MNRRTAFVLGTIGVLLLAAPLRADTISYQYDWSQSTAEVDVGGSRVIFQNVSHGTGPGLIPGPITAATVSASSTASVANPDQFAGQKFTMTVVLTDGNDHGTASFVGHLWGSLSSMGADLTATFDPQTSKTLLLGDHLYTINIGPFLGLQYTILCGGGDFGDTGSVNATVTTSTYTGDWAPEPPAWILAALGVGALVAGWRFWSLPFA
jgi:hypothetical protein